MEAGRVKSRPQNNKYAQRLPCYEQSSAVGAVETCESGISLLETLLSLGIIAVIIIGVFEVTNDFAESVLNRREANYLSEVHTAAQSYVKANFSNILSNGFSEDLSAADNSDLNNIGRAVAITIEDEGGFFLKDETASLPQGFPERSPSRRGVRIYARNLGFIGKDIAFEVITLTYAADPDAEGQRPITGMRLHDIVNVLGASAGMYLAIDNSATAGDESQGFVSKYGAWEVQVADLQGANVIGPNPYDAFEPDNAKISGYVGIRSVVTFRDSLDSDYLYRLPIAGQSELNVMDVNIDMDGNPISNVNTITADNFSIAGDFNVGFSSGSPTGASAFFVDEVMHVETDATVQAQAVGVDPDCGFSGASGNRTLNPGATGCLLTGGNLIVSGVPGANIPGGATESVRVGTLNALSAQGDGVVQAPNIDVAENLTIQGDAVFSGAADIAGTVTTGGVAGQAINVQNSLDTGVLQVTSMPAAQGVQNISTGAMIAGIMRPGAQLSMNSLRVTGNMDTRDLTVSGSMQTDQFSNRTLPLCQATRVHRFPYGPDDFFTVPAFNCVTGPN